MDISKIKRRERRFYRKEEEGEIDYDEKPINKLPEPRTRNISDKTLDSINENNRLSVDEKQQIIDKILKDMQKSINPDIDEIADMIYSQLSSRDVNVSQETVKQVVQNNAHYRSSRKERMATTSIPASEKETKESFDFLNDRKELEVVIDDIVEENQKEDIRAKEKKNTEKAQVKEVTNRRTATKVSEKKETAPKEKEKPKPKEEPKKEFKLDFGDDEEIESSSDDDDLGLKF